MTPGTQPANPLLNQYNTLMAAIGLGAKVVRFQDRTVEYQSTDEMIKAANYLYLQLASQGLIPGVTGVNRQIRCYTNKGL
jgi:hypothetical protein